MSNNNESMEIQLLREMIQDREARMARIQSKTDDLQQKSKRLAGELEQVSKENTESSIVLTTERTQLMHLRQKAIDQLETTERDFQRQSTSLQSFAQIVAKQTSNQKDINNVDVAFVSKMQAQLCKAMHSMGILDHQMELCRMHSDAHIKAEKENLVLVTEELSSVELNLMNELMKMDTERREVENDLTKQLDDVRKDIKAMQEQLGEGSDEENSDEDSQKESEEEVENDEQEEEESEEEDEEEREIKEELMNVLQEKKDELRKLEKTIEEYEEQILELEEHVEEMKAQAEDAAKRRAKKIEENGGIDPDARPVTPDAADQIGSDEPAQQSGRDCSVDQLKDVETGNETKSPVNDCGTAEDLIASDKVGGKATEELETAALENSTDVVDEEHEFDQEAHDEEVVQYISESVHEKNAEEVKEDVLVSEREDHLGAGAMLTDVVQVNPSLEESVEGEENRDNVSASNGEEDLSQNDFAENDPLTVDEPADIEPAVEDAKEEESGTQSQEESADFAANEGGADSGAAADAIEGDNGVSVTDEEIGDKAVYTEIGEKTASQSPLVADQTSHANEVEAEQTSEVDDDAEKHDGDESAFSVTGAAVDTGANDTPEVEDQHQ